MKIFDSLSKRINLKKQAVVLIITVLALYFILRQISFSDVVGLAEKMSVFWLFVGFFFYSLGYIFRALRFSLFVEIKRKKLFSVVCIHNLLNNLLPFRVGELSYMYLLKKQGVAYAQGFGSLLITRIFDFIVISVIFIVSVVSSGFMSSAINPLEIVISLLAFIILLLAAMVFFRQRFSNFVSAIFRLLHLEKRDCAKGILAKIHEILLIFEKLKNKKHLLSIIAYSFFVWFSIYASYLALFRGFFIDVPFWRVILGVSFVFYVVMLPLYGVGGFGTIELSWAFSFFYLGLSKELAIASGLLFHLAFILYFTLLGVYGIFSFYFGKHEG